MKRLFKNGILAILSLGFLFVIFFFWASAPTLPIESYESIGKLDHAMAPENDSTFSIVTYNIGYLSGMTNNTTAEKPKSLFEGNLELVKSQVKKVNPDIIALQEIDYKAKRSHWVDQHAELVNLGYPFYAKAINWDERYLPFPYWPPKMHFGNVVSGQSIVSKYALKDHKREVLERVANAPFYRDAFYLERLAQVATVTLNGQDVVIINVHLEAFDKPTRMNQFKEIEAIYQSYKDNFPVLLLGDFNSKYRDESAGIQSVLNDPELGCAAIDTSIANTYNSKNPHKRIDYIFYTKNSIEELEGRVLHEFGEASDHLPVYMKFRLKQ